MSCGRKGILDTTCFLIFSQLTVKLTALSDGVSGFMIAFSAGVLGLGNIVVHTMVEG